MKYEVLVLPEPDGPIINILNGQLLRSEELDSVVCSEDLVFLLLTILSKFKIFIR